MKFIIDFDNSVTDSDVQSYCQTNGCQILKTFDAFERCYVVECEQRPPQDSMVTHIIDDDATQIKPLVYDSNSTAIVNHTSEDQWWMLATIKGIDLNSQTSVIPRRGGDACVYILDSGIDVSHSEFADADVAQLYSFNGDHTDYNGHGTAIASVISGATCGISSAKLRAVKIFQSGVATYQSHILGALDAIYNDMQANPGRFALINMSWSIPRNQWVENKIRALIANGAWAVCAAGNSGVQINDVTPASMPEVYAIGAFSRNLEPCDFSNLPSDLSNTSNTNNTGEHWAWAPGEHIRAAVGSDFGFVSGTSIAAAIASATIVYNTWIYLRDDGTVPSLMDYYDLVPIYLSTAPADILELPPEYQQYQQQYSRRVLFNVYKYGESIDIRLGATGFKLFYKSGQSFEFRMLDPIYDESIEYMDPLDPGLTVNGKYIQGQITTDTYYVKTINYTVRMHTGQLLEKRIFLYVTSDAYSPETVPEQDQLLPLELLVNTCCTNSPGVGDGCNTGSGCFTCTNCSGDKQAPQCINNDCFDPGCGTQSCP